MVAMNSTPQEERDGFDVGSHDEWTETERGHYSQALREGQVRRLSPNAPRIVNTWLWVFNLVGWLLLAFFIGWRIRIFFAA